MAHGRKILDALDEAIAHAKGHKTGARTTVVRVPGEIDVRAIRAKLKLSQEAFAHQFGVSVGTVRHWEQGSRAPEGPARVLLKIIDRNPKAVIEALSS